MKRILISNVNPSDNGFFVPLIYANLRSYCEADPELNGKLDWVDPPMMPEEFAEMDRRLDFSTIDVCGISCYQWNYAYQFEFAQYVKSKNPNCLIVAGGPHLSYPRADRLDFFERNDFVDLVVPGEGEEPFRQLLISAVAGVVNFEKLVGVHIHPRHGNFSFKATPAIDLSTRPSPWLSLKDFWRGFFSRHSKFRLAASYESSRGCPYFCTFCDWGSATNSRMRLVPTELVKEELEFLLCELKPSFIFWTDSNLGMAERDVETVRHFVECKLKSGYPKHLYYSNNKNNYLRNIEIAEEFRRARLLTKYTLSLQHLDDEVISNLRRKNLPSDQIEKLVKRLKKIDYPIFVQFIIGCPGDTFAKWLGAFAKLMELGVHSEYRVYPFNLLPNAPAADPEYRNKWQIEVIERPDFVTYYYIKGKKLNWALSQSQYVIGSNTFSRDEYKRMNVLTWMLMVFHDHGLTRLISQYLRHSRGISYEVFYGRLFDWFESAEAGGRYSNELKAHIERWVTDSTANLMVYNANLDGLIEPEEDLRLKIAADTRSFYLHLAPFLVSEFDAPPDLISFQEKAVYGLDFDPAGKQSIELDQSWLDYFEQIDRVEIGDQIGSVSEPSSVNFQEFEIDLTPFSIFPNPWYLEKNLKTRSQLFHSQIIQHNVHGRQRTGFKLFLKSGARHAQRVV